MWVKQVTHRVLSSKNCNLDASWIKILCRTGFIIYCNFAKSLLSHVCKMISHFFIDGCYIITIVQLFSNASSQKLKIDYIMTLCCRFLKAVKSPRYYCNCCHDKFKGEMDAFSSFLSEGIWLLPLEIDIAKN